MTKKERLEALISYYSAGNKSQFARKLGITAQGISTWLARDTFDIDLIYSKCENISSKWLLTGQGNMIRNIGGSDDGAKEQIETRPRIPLDAAAGALSIVDQSITEGECEYLPVIPRLPRYDFTIFARGDSMEPEFQSGDELACRFINERGFIQWGRPHVLDTAQGIVVKRIFEDADSIICRSDNPKYRDFPIPKDEIYRIALVVGVVRIY